MDAAPAARTGLELVNKQVRWVEDGDARQGTVVFANVNQAAVKWTGNGGVTWNLAMVHPSVLTVIPRD
jgi:hypothetical protein